MVILNISGNTTMHVTIGLYTGEIRKLTKLYFSILLKLTHKFIPPVLFHNLSHSNTVMLPVAYFLALSLCAQTPIETDKMVEKRENLKPS